MNTTFKITSALLTTIRIDLARQHPFAHERVGFISAGLSAVGHDLIVVAREYRPVEDDDYLRDHTVGAMMGPDAIRKALQWAMDTGVALFHVHTHGGRGVPEFSGVDIRESAKFVPDFFKVAGQSAHGAIVLSGNAARGKIWLERKGQPFTIDSYTEVGMPDSEMESGMTRLDRQSFLGPNGNQILDGATVGIVGLGGGGSHVAQQFAHMGVGGYVLADPDHIENTNTNRLIGGTLKDVAANRSKVEIAKRLIRGLQPDARIVPICKSWHDAVDDLKRCDVIVGAVDSFRQRDQLERFARCYLIPYIDIGMDVHEIGKLGFLISGQVILSLPGHPCLRCCGLITDERLEQEDNRYGAAGSRPQVVWPNGVMASTAVGLAAQVLTAWYSRPPAFVYLEYDGNKGTMIRSARMESLKHCVCPHHPADETGDPLFDIRKHLEGMRQGQIQPRSLMQRIASWLKAKFER